MISNKRIAVIGLGYVGLPLARLFATKYPLIRHQSKPD
jgi:UDP-N-acetyl-D-galactosamine dehydrogenase